MTIRERTEQIEEQTLAPWAALSKNSLGRDFDADVCDIRTCYRRDCDRIIHCKAFRRLKRKTQVFLSPEGDHYRTRLTHTLEVAQIARTIARALRLNEDLTEAISLGHDLGHTPFGHAGERALNGIMPGGFRHYEQSVRVVEKLENNGKGLNLTKEVRDGILCHTRGKEAMTLEGRIVKISDRIAYINHDIEDAQRAGVLREEDLPEKAVKVLGSRRTARINTLVHSIVENSHDGILAMDPKVQEVFDELHAFMYERVYHNPRAKGEEKKVPELVEQLFDYFMKNPQKLPDQMQLIAYQEGLMRAVCDHVAAMTDHFAVQTFTGIYVPNSWSY